MMITPNVPLGVAHSNAHFDQGLLSDERGQVFKEEESKGICFKWLRMIDDLGGF
jgi:hypothetical protein